MEAPLAQLKHSTFFGYSRYACRTKARNEKNKPPDTRAGQGPPSEEAPCAKG